MVNNYESKIRKSVFAFGRLQDMIEAFKLFYERYGRAVRTITADNGSEFISWDFLEYVQKSLKSNSNTVHHDYHINVGQMKIGMVSFVIGFPKAPILSQLDKRKQLDDVADKMNAMPMRIALQGKSPIELFDKEYKTMQRYRRAYEKRKLKQIKQN